MLIGFVVTLLVIGVGAAAGTAVVLHDASQAPPLSDLHALTPGGNSEVFAADGTRLGYIQSDVLRSPISYRDIPAHLIDATVAIEDQRYWQHGGVDVKGILRAAVKDALSGEPLQGGSTIAMQLVRNIYLPQSERTDDTLKRKIVEAVEADRLEKIYSKQTILSKYLNSVPYGTVGGQNAIGVAAAARIFFNATVGDLDLAQSALLAGLPQAPSEYNPFIDPAAAMVRRNEVLEKMAQLHYITQAQADTAIASPLQVHHSTYYNQHRESYFFDFVTQELIDRYGVQTVEQGGLHVYTTIDLHLQHLAQEAINNVLDEPGDPSAAIVTEDPNNGYILAMAQSMSSSQYNLAAQGHRQPGLTFKAIVLADALERGIDPDTTYILSHTLAPDWLPGYYFPVKTFEGVSLNREISLTQATVTSDNTVYAQLAADLGIQSVTNMAYRLGVVTHLDSNPSEALGGLRIGVSPLEMANVYATLADGGYRNKQIAITRVVFPGGHTDGDWGDPHRVKVVSTGVTAEETKILEENVEHGTAVNSAIGCPTAAKTGTTSDLVDAWLDGYTANYSTVVWMGYPNKRISMTDVHGEPQQGGALPAVIWHDYMEPVVGTDCVPFHQATQPIDYQPFTGPYGDIVSGAAGGSVGFGGPGTGIGSSPAGTGNGTGGSGIVTGLPGNGGGGSGGGGSGGGGSHGHRRRRADADGAGPDRRDRQGRPGGRPDAEWRRLGRGRRQRRRGPGHVRGRRQRRAERLTDVAHPALPEVPHGARAGRGHRRPAPRGLGDRGDVRGRQDRGRVARPAARPRRAGGVHRRPPAGPLRPR